MFDAVIQFAHASLRGLFIANGAAAIAAMTMLPALFDKPAATDEIIGAIAGAAHMFGRGVAAAVFAAMLSYLAQVCFSEYWIKTNVPGSIFRSFAIVAAGLSAIFFICGVETAASGFID